MTNNPIICGSWENQVRCGTPCAMPNDVDLALLTVVIVIVGIAVAVINFVGLSIYM